jgi:bacillithiol system protein YtxJ
MRLSWIEITSVEQLNQLWSQETKDSCVFFKHSTRCSISSMVLRSFERSWVTDEQTTLFFIDLIAHRDVSNQLALLSGVEHQSPQVIVTHKNQVIFSDSHGTIDAEKIQHLIQQANV